MSIALDTNVLQRARRLDAMQMTVLAAVARETGLRVWLPEIVLEESVSLRLREATSAITELHAARDRLVDLGANVSMDAPDPAQVASNWRRDLETRFSVEPLSEEGARESLLREVRRVPPTRDGKGARDAAVWLTVKSVHLKSEGPTYFVSENVKDFGKPEANDELHPGLATEVADTGRPLVFARSLTALLERLAKRVDIAVDLKTLQDSQAAVAAVIAHGQETRVLLAATDAELEAASMTTSYIATRVEAIPLRVRATQGYEVGGARITVAWTDWRLSFEAGALRRFPYGGVAEVTMPVVAEGSFQMWLRSAEDAAAITEAQVTAMSGVRIISTGEPIGP